MALEKQIVAPNIPTDTTQALAVVALGHPSDRTEIYGDEAGRFEDLKTWTYDAFKSRLIDLNNEVQDDQEPVTGFVDHNNIIGAGFMGMAGADIHFPNPTDKDELLTYALEKAQSAKSVQDAALILGTAVVAVHPFAEGNGRTSRGLYASLSRGWGKTNKEYQAITRPHGRVEQDEVAREKVNLGSVLDEGLVGKYSRWYPYHKSGVDIQSAPLASFKKDEKLRVLFPDSEQLPHVSTTDYQAVRQAVGIGENGTLRTIDVHGLRFALAKVIQAHGLSKKYVVLGGEFPKVDLANILQGESGGIAHELAEAIGDYRKLRAVAAIDFLSDEIGGKMITRDEDGQPISIKELIINEGNNYSHRG